MSTGRPLREEARTLLALMLSSSPFHAELVSNLDDRVAEDMQDGGMGSIRFMGGAGRYGGAIAEAEYTDDDGVLVSIALNTDVSGGPLRA